MSEIIIVLGGGVDEKGNIPDEVKERILLAKKIYEKKKQFILMTGFKGMYEKKIIKISEAKAMKTFAKEKGIPSKNILTENKARDTIGNAFFSRTILETKKITRATIITSQYHMKRVKYIFNKIFSKKYTLMFESSKEVLNNSYLEEKNKKEKELILKTKKFLESLKTTDLNELKKWIFSIHPSYSKKLKINKYFLGIKDNK